MSSALCSVSVCPAVVLTQLGVKVEFCMSTVVVVVGTSQDADAEELHPTALSGSAMRTTASVRRIVRQRSDDRASTTT